MSAMVSAFRAARRRAGDVASVEIVLAVVAIAKDVALIFAKFDNAGQVCAGGGESANVGVTELDDNDGLVAEADPGTKPAGSARP